MAALIAEVLREQPRVMLHPLDVLAGLVVAELDQFGQCTQHEIARFNGQEPLARSSSGAKGLVR